MRLIWRTNPPFHLSYRTPLWALITLPGFHGLMVMQAAFERMVWPLFAASAIYLLVVLSVRAWLLTRWYQQNNQPQPTPLWEPNNLGVADEPR